MFKIFLFFIFVATQTFAYDSNYITDFGIYVYGDIQAIQNAFILVQTIAQSNMLPWILAMIGAFFLPYSAYEYFRTQDFTRFIANLTFMTVSFLTLDTANLGVTVHIEDLRVETSVAGLPAKTYAKIDDIPYPIALVTSTVSTIVDGIKREFEDAIQIINVSNGLDVNGMSYEGVGFMGGLGDILKITKMASFSLDSNLSKFGRASQAYINDCVLKQAITINQDLISVLKTPPNDIFKAISPASIGLTGATSTITYNGSTDTCEAFYNNEISANYATTAQALIAKLDKSVEGDLTSNNYINSLRSAGAEINDSFIPSDVGKFFAYGMNVAALAPISNAFRNYLTDINSGQDVANV
ncbi:MAG TPA: hypothetical protein EYG85_01890, partial [Crocinitomix sp.]|nr:hypothetical protein [Crocinitomix sp.]